MALQSPGHHLGQMEECCSAKGREIDELARHGDQRRVLRLVLAINASMFVAEFAAGLIAGSAALVADSVDMLGDAFVYVLSLFALDRSERWRAGAALAKGFTILALGLGVLAEIGVKIGQAPSEWRGSLSSQRTRMGVFLSSGFLVCAGSLFGAERPFLVPSPAIRFAERAERCQGTEMLAQLSGLPLSVACVFAAP